MIPSTGPPFAMTRWVAQTRQNYVSVTPYNYSDHLVHGFQGTHQPAIWMGESAQVVVIPGAGPTVKARFEDRGLRFSHEEEVVSASYYSVKMRGDDGEEIFAEQSASEFWPSSGSFIYINRCSHAASRVGHLRFTFTNTSYPHILVEATRPTTLGSPASPSTLTVFPNGTIYIDPDSREITGTNPERQDTIIGPVSTPASSFRGYFCARFDQPFEKWGTVSDGVVHENIREGEGRALSAFVRFGVDVEVVEVRIGVSFISVEQARRNLDKEVPNGTRLEGTAKKTRAEWKEKLDRVAIEGANEEEKDIFYTAFYHTLQVSGSIGFPAMH
jgi:putative alpha-1,2-mannosidase